jgi:hypothetical protein
MDHRDHQHAQRTSASHSLTVDCARDPRLGHVTPDVSLAGHLTT